MYYDAGHHTAFTRVRSAVIPTPAECKKGQQTKPKTRCRENPKMPSRGQRDVKRTTQRGVERITGMATLGWNKGSHSPSIVVRSLGLASVGISEHCRVAQWIVHFFKWRGPFAMLLEEQDHQCHVVNCASCPSCHRPSVPKSQQEKRFMD